MYRMKVKGKVNKNLINNNNNLLLLLCLPVTQQYRFKKRIFFQNNFIFLVNYFRILTNLVIILIVDLFF